MDPSKFSVRVTNPTMIRQERFSDFCGFNVPVKTTEYAMSSINSDNYEKKTASWCAPRRAQTVGSSSSIGNDSSDNEVRTKNLRNVRRWTRGSEHARRTEKLTRPRGFFRRLCPTRDIQSKDHTKIVNRPQIINSQTEISAKSPVVEEKPIRHRQPTDRISKLAEPKIHESLGVNSLGKVDERALFAVVFETFRKKCSKKNVKLVAYMYSKASKRIAELATPKNSSSSQDPSIVKRDPFGVNPEALRAICTPRIEQLARPKKIASSFSSTKQISAENVNPIGI